jgi:hypothetical protein
MVSDYKGVIVSEWSCVWKGSSEAKWNRPKWKSSPKGHSKQEKEIGELDGQEHQNLDLDLFIQIETAGLDPADTENNPDILKISDLDIIVYM